MNAPINTKVAPREICCVFVFYFPERTVPQKLETLAKYGYKIVVVSNGADALTLSEARRIENVNVIQNDINVGLATALNQGIAAALENTEVRFVALFDQDSEPGADLPELLANEFHTCGRLDVGCLGPQLVDVKASGTAYRHHNESADTGCVTSIPTSGSVISKEAFQLVGPMMDALFIDGIDHEWCLRAAAKGLRIVVSQHVAMLHNMGDDAVNWFGSYKPLYSNPIRHYYIVRNAIYLGLHGDLPFRWRATELLKTFRRIPAYLWASKDKSRSLGLICRAIINGADGRLGPLNEAPKKP